LSSYNIVTETNDADAAAVTAATTVTTTTTDGNGNNNNNNNKLFNVVYNIMKPRTIGKMLLVLVNP
jgi:hypothetical protein